MFPSDAGGSHAIHTEYALTELGRTLLAPLRVLCRWAERHYGEVREQRERADRRSRWLLSLINGKVHEGIHKYYAIARERKGHAQESVEAGRAYVQAYVPFLHFVERLYNDAVTPIAHGAGEGGHAGPSGHAEPHAH